MYFTMTIPTHFLPQVLDGTVKRYGCILKHVANGRIVGHLTDAGRATSPVGSLPVNSFPSLLKTAGALAAEARDGKLAGVASLPPARLLKIQQTLRLPNVQVGQLQQVLNYLQLVSTVGAAASVANLGVSAVGFLVVVRKLDRLEQNLNRAMGQLLAEVEKVRLKLDNLEMADLMTAWQLLDSARETDRPGRSEEMLGRADGTLHKYRNYYFALITELRPLEKPQLSLPQVRELYGRYFACCAAELEANFLLHDFAQWRKRHEVIGQQLQTAFRFDTLEVFRSRVPQGQVLTQAELEGLKEQAVLTRDFCQENVDRLLSAVEEVKWVEQRRLTPTQYLDALRNAPEEGVVLVRHDE